MKVRKRTKVRTRTVGGVQSTKRETVFFMDYYATDRESGQRRRFQKTLEAVSTKREAEDLAKRIWADMTHREAAGALAGPSLTDLHLTLAALLAADRKRPGVSAATIRREAEVARALLEFFGEERVATQVTTADVKAYKTHRAKLKPSSLNKELNVLRAALRRAVKDHRLTFMPCEVERAAEGENEARALSEKEVGALLEACKKHKEPDMYDRVVVLLGLGLRPIELWRMTWGQLDLKAATLRVQSAKRGASKTIRSYELPLNKAVLAVLKARQPKKPEKDDLVFGIAPENRGEALNGKRLGKPGYEGGVVVLRDYRFAEKLKACAAAAGLAKPKEITPYTLRHTFGTRVAESAPIHVAARLMKHADIRMMQRYAHPDRDRMREAVENLKLLPVGENLREAALQDAGNKQLVAV